MLAYIKFPFQHYEQNLFPLVNAYEDLRKLIKMMCGRYYSQILQSWSDKTLVWTQFVVQTDSVLAQRAQDNKFVESGLEN